MVMVMATAADSLRQILYVGQLATRRSVRKVAREMRELVRRSRIAVRLCSLGGAGQVRGDLLSNLLVLGWARLLKLLERTQHLAEGRKLAAIGLVRCSRRAVAAQAAACSVECAAEDRLHAGKKADGAGAHILNLSAFLAPFSGNPKPLKIRIEIQSTPPKS